MIRVKGLLANVLLGLQRCQARAVYPFRRAGPVAAPPPRKRKRGGDSRESTDRELRGQSAARVRRCGRPRTQCRRRPVSAPLTFTFTFTFTCHLSPLAARGVWNFLVLDQLFLYYQLQGMHMCRAAEHSK